MAMARATNIPHFQCVPRIMKEIRLCMDSFETDGVDAKLKDESNIGEFTGRIKGPRDTVFESGIFLLNISLPIDFPYAPPKVYFITPVFHTNVSSQSGAICVDILRDKWAASTSLLGMMKSLQMLLTTANDLDPQDSLVATIKRDNREMYEKTARFWTAEFADGDSNLKDVEYERMVQCLVDMGLNRGSVVKRLSWNKWNGTGMGLNMIANSLLLEPE